jgi:signal transduction histidine kinase
MSLAPPRWLRHPSDRLKDLALALVLAPPVVGVTVHEATHRHVPIIAVVGVAGLLLLFVRRRHPVAAFTAIAALGVADPSGVVMSVPGIVALALVASTRPSRTITLCVATYLGAQVLQFVAWNETVDAGRVVGPALLATAAVAFGLNVAARRAKIDALRERAERMDRERELLAEQAVSDERVRIARDLHDVVAHNVSLMIVQAQALGATVPEPKVVDATDGIADLGRQVMAEMHRTLTLLRSDDDHGEGRAPRPGLANLDNLLEQSRAAGVRVDLAIEGSPHPLSEGLDLSAFRIVQEALTNVRNHAGGADTHVTVAYRPDMLELTIHNARGMPRAASNGGSGQGIAGMRERAALFGGRLAAERSDSGGFEVHATLPYDAAPQS